MDAWDLFAAMQPASGREEADDVDSRAAAADDRPERRGETSPAKSLAMSLAAGKLLLEEDPDAAAEHFEAAVAQENAEAHRLLALCLARRTGSRLDIDRCHRLLADAATLGDGPAALLLARHKLALEEPDAAVAYLRMAADAGQPDAMALLGDHMVSSGAAGQAIALYERAAAEGCVHAMNSLVVVHSLGCGTDVDEEAAVDWGHRAAAAGHLSFAAERLLCANAAFSRAEERARRARRTATQQEPGWERASMYHATPTAAVSAHRDAHLSR